jgi:hypothetical protein
MIPETPVKVNYQLGEHRDPVPNNASSSYHVPAHQHEQFSQLSNEYLKRRYRKKYENPDKIRELLNDQIVIVEHLRTAVEGKMDIAAVGVLNDIILALDSGNHDSNTSVSKHHFDAGDRQRALYKANICPMIYNVLNELGGQANVCERALLAVAFLCRYSDENKNSVCLENAKQFGLLQISDLIVGAIKRHNDNKNIMIASCDAVRCLSLLESNRDRLGQSGACESIARGITKYMNSPDVLTWIVRAIGHLANNNDGNRELLGTAGACQNILLIIQNYSSNMNLCVECCYAIRHLALGNENNRSRFANDFAPETILAIYRSFFHQEVFALEANHALVNLIADEKDDLLPRIVNANYIALATKSLRKCMSSEFVVRWVLQMFYYLSRLDKVATKLIANDILEILSMCFEQHAGYEEMAEWGCRLVHSTINLEDASSRMRNAGFNEMVTSAVQRQAISGVVSSVGSLAIGDLARDPDNQSRLSSAGACEAVVGALKRHHNSADVCSNSCYAIHYLCKEQNNVSWMGAYGACEAVNVALQKHSQTSPEVAVYACNAIGSLAYKDDGNQLRFHACETYQSIVNCLIQYPQNPLIAANSCRAIYNLCYESANVSEFGKVGACGLVVNALQEHANNTLVVTQSLLAMHTLAVRVKSDKIHKGNTRKLIAKGAIEMVVAAMQKFLDHNEVQAAAGMAISSLARLDANKTLLGENGICELIRKSMTIHIRDARVMEKLTLAVDILSHQNEANQQHFTTLNIISLLLDGLQKHDKHPGLVATTFRCLITLANVKDNANAVVFQEQFLKLYSRLLRQHDKEVNVFLYGCQLLYTAASVDNLNRSILGKLKNCEFLVQQLLKYGEGSSNLAAWGCKAIVALSLFDGNKEKFHTPDSSTLLNKLLKAHYVDVVVAEWCTAAIVSTASFAQPRAKLGQLGVLGVLTHCLALHHSNEVILKLVCEAFYELCQDAQNQALVATQCVVTSASIAPATAAIAANNSAKSHHEDSTPHDTPAGPVPILGNIFQIMVSIYNDHMGSVNFAIALCKAISSLTLNQTDNGVICVEAGIIACLLESIPMHIMVPLHVTWAFSAIASLTGQKKPSHQIGFLENTTLIENLSQAMTYHAAQIPAMIQVARCIRALAIGNSETQLLISQDEHLLRNCMQILQIHYLHETIVEHVSWILGSVEYRPLLAVSAVNMAAEQSQKAATVESSASPVRTVPRSISMDTMLLSPDTAVATTAGTAHAVTTTSTAKRLKGLMYEFYTSPVYWDLFYQILFAHPNKPLVIRWVCTAISLFSDKGKVTSSNLCTILMQYVERYVQQETELSRLLQAIGSLAKNSLENNECLSELNICLILERILQAHSEGQQVVVLYGVLPCIAGLVTTPSSFHKSSIPHVESETELDGSVAAGVSVKGRAWNSLISVKNQEIFLTSKTLHFNFASLLYHELENEFLAQTICHAVYALCTASGTAINLTGSPKPNGTSPLDKAHQMKFAPLCSYFHDILLTHKTSSPVILEAVRAISSMSSQNITLRNRLGNAGICSSLIAVMYYYYGNNTTSAGGFTEPLLLSSGVNATNLASASIHPISKTTVSVNTANAEAVNASWKLVDKGGLLLFWFMKCLGNITANNPNNQTKLGRHAICELLVDILKSRVLVARKYFYSPCLIENCVIKFCRYFYYR